MSNLVSSRFATAIHESGHAVYALVMGWPVERVSLHQDGRYAGVCSFTIRDGAPPAEIAAVFLAGFLAEKFVASDTSAETANTDVNRALPYIARLDVSLDNLVLQVRRRLASLWTEIDQLATALDKQGSLDSGSILRAIKTPVSWLQMPPPAWLR
jgi:hypothetical protein